MSGLKLGDRVRCVSVPEPEYPGEKPWLVVGDEYVIVENQGPHATIGLRPQHDPAMPYVRRADGAVSWFDAERFVLVEAEP
jgi:hypothetical protein